MWRALRTVPYGATASYGAIAAAIGRPRAVRATGAANGRNPVSIVIPCHRIVGADGSPTGYAGGIARKEWLLLLENGIAIFGLTLVGGIPFLVETTLLLDLVAGERVVARRVRRWVSASSRRQ